MKKLILFMLSTFLFLFLFGCSGDTQENPIEETIYPTPTTHKLFKDSGETTADAPFNTATMVPTVASYFSEPVKPTATPAPTKMPTALVSPTPSAVAIQEMITSTEVLTISIFDDSMNTNWIAMPKDGLLVDLDAAAPVHSGSKSIGVIPGQSFSSINFLVKEDSSEQYLRDNIIGFRFWLNSGTEYISTSNLAVSVLGSNEYPYWVEGDNSVQSDISPVFSETRLYFLGVNRTIPPDTWVQVDVPIHQLKYDPDYRYVVGFYIKNDAGFTSEYFIDDIELFALSGGIIPSDFSPASSSGKVE